MGELVSFLGRRLPNREKSASTLTGCSWTLELRGGLGRLVPSKSTAVMYRSHILENELFSMPSHARLLFGHEQKSIGRHSLTNSPRWHVPGAQDLSQADKEPGTLRIRVSPPTP